MFERLDPPEFRPGEGFRAAVVTRGRRMRRRRHQAVGAALGTVVLMAAVVGVTAGWSKQQFDSIERVEVQDLPTQVDALEGEPFNVLVVGVDGPRPIDSGTVGERADTMMVVRVEPDAGKVQVVSLPRDLWVRIPGHGEERLNTALPFGGPSLLVGTVESALGIPVDRYLQIDFDGFTRMVDAAGVRVHFPYPARAKSSSLEVPTPGCVTLDGPKALALVRARKDLQWLVDGEWRGDTHGDIGRMLRQQTFGRLLLASLGDASSLQGKATLLARYADFVTMDSYWTREQLDGLIDFAADLGPNDVSSRVLPVTDAVVHGAQVLVPIEAAPAVQAALRGDVPDPHPGAAETAPDVPTISPC
jgi:LCP family protein required for cell wall assembly